MSFTLISMDFHGFPWISMDFHGFPWISMDFHGFPMDFHGRSMDVPWAFHGLSMDFPWTFHGRSMNVPRTSMDIHVEDISKINQSPIQNTKTAQYRATRHEIEHL